MNKSLRRWLWLGASVIVLGLIVRHFGRNPEWRSFRWERSWSSLVRARPGYMLAAAAAVYSSYVLRAYRWKFFLAPIKKASLWVLFVGQILGFSAVYLIGRAGELVRPAYIARKENVPFTAMMAVWLLERIYDNVFIILMFSAALYFGPIEPATARTRSALAMMQWAGIAILLVAALLVQVLVLFRVRAESMTARALRLVGFLPAKARERLERFLRSFADGLDVIRNWKDLLASVASTAALWFINASVFWLVFRGMGGDLARLSWLAGVLVLYLSVLGMVLQIPGVGGGFQVVAIWVLTGFFRVKAEDATGAAIFLWFVMSLPCLALGLVLLVHEGLTFRKLRAIAGAERAATAQKT